MSRPKNKTHPLSEPIEVDGKRIGSVTMHRANGKLFRLLAKYADPDRPEAIDPSVIPDMIQSLCGLSEREFDALDLTDVEALIGMLPDFLPQTPATPST